MISIVFLSAMPSYSFSDSLRVPIRKIDILFTEQASISSLKQKLNEAWASLFIDNKEEAFRVQGEISKDLQKLDYDDYLMFIGSDIELGEQLFYSSSKLNSLLARYAINKADLDLIKNSIHLATENIGQYGKGKGALFLFFKVLNKKELEFTFITLDAGNGFIDSNGDSIEIDEVVKLGNNSPWKESGGRGLTRIERNSHKLSITEVHQLNGKKEGSYWVKRNDDVKKGTIPQSELEKLPIEHGAKIIFIRKVRGDFTPEASVLDSPVTGQVVSEIRLAGGALLRTFADKEELNRLRGKEGEKIIFLDKDTGELKCIIGKKEIKESVWGIHDSSLYQVNEILKTDIMNRIVEKIVEIKNGENPDRVITIVDAGCGNSGALIDIERVLKQREVKNVRLVGFGDIYFSNKWEEANEYVEFVLGDFGDMAKFISKFDFTYSCYGVTHLPVKEYIELLKAIRERSSDGAVLVHEYPFYKDRSAIPELHRGGFVILNEVDIDRRDIDVPFIIRFKGGNQNKTDYFLSPEKSLQKYL